MSTKATIENIIIALLQTQSPFTNSTTAPVLNYDADTTTVAKRNRVVVKAMEPIALIPGKTPTSPNKVSQSDVEIRIQLATANATTMNTWDAAVDTALATAPTAVATLAAASFASGFHIDNVTNGDRQGDGAENRERNKMVRVVFIP